ncbi:hypothetical protein [Sphingorhabdus sp.]|uniref:hypothetical protein n=1 Tax=Sphingorhabdus sp. TaxID=1902408 RepID=UPI0035B2DD9F|nr:hypothetical protein [Sphingomonadaceae bacterium]
MTGWIFALAAAVGPTPPAPPVRVQAAATVTIIRMERIDMSAPTPRNGRSLKRQTGARGRAVQIDFY